MTLNEAKKIGSRQGLIFVWIGIMIAQIIMTFLTFSQGLIKAFFWFTEINYLSNILIGLIIMFICGHFYGQLAGKLILIKGYNFMLIGCLTGVFIIMSTSFLASWFGFFKEGIDGLGTMDNPYYDYVFKPTYWVTLFGLFPSLFLGTLFGAQIKKKSKINSNS